MAQRIAAEKEPWPLPSLRADGNELEPIVRSALAAYDRINQERATDPGSLAVIVCAASDSRVSIYESVTELLAHLTAQHQAARDAVTRMSVDRRWQVRFNAVLSLGRGTPPEFSIGTISALLLDKSARVREKAADRALRLELRGMVDALASAASAETNERARKEIEFALAMLRDGYSVEPAGDGSIWVTVWIEGRAVGRSYSREDFEYRGVHSIVRSLHDGA